MMLSEGMKLTPEQQRRIQEIMSVCGGLLALDPKKYDMRVTTKHAWTSLLQPELVGWLVLHTDKPISYILESMSPADVYFIATRGVTIPRNRGEMR